MLSNSIVGRVLNILLLGMISLLQPGHAFAQAESRPDLSYRIVASRFGQDVYYSPGTRLCIKYKRGQSEIKERGYFAGVLNDKIILTPDKVGSYRIAIPPEDIIYLRKIRPLKRVIAGASGVAMITGGLLVFESIVSSSQTMGAALIGFPLVIAGVVFIYYVPVSLIFEKINERKRINGWEFRLIKN